MNQMKYIEPAVMFITMIVYVAIAVLIGIVAGTTVGLFLKSLNFLSGKTGALPVPYKMLLLPVGGLLNGLLLYKMKPGAPSAIAAVHSEGEPPFDRSFPVKYLAALITLVSGGSAGKFGPSAHFAGSLAAWIGKIFHIQPFLRAQLIVCGISAAFASLFGAPVAAAMFGLEVLAIGSIRHQFLFPSAVSGIAAFEVNKRLLHTPYEYFMIHAMPSFSVLLLLKVAALGMICGLAGWLFVESIEQGGRLFSVVREKLHLPPFLMPCVGGMLIAAALFIFPADFLGLSLPLLDKAMHGGHVGFFAFLWKILFVAVTLGSGFYGGTFTPQLVIGSAAGNAFAALLGINPVLGAAAGMLAVVSAASNTPVSAVLLGYELYGHVTGMYMLAACIAGYLIIGHRSVYRDQLVYDPKSFWVQLEPGVELRKESIRLSSGTANQTGRFHLPW